MKNYILLLVVLFISGCSTIGYLIYPVYTFERGFNEMLKLDKKYNASFYTEALDVENRFSDYRIYDFDWNRTIVSIEKVDMMVADLKKTEEKIKAMEETEDTKLVVMLLDSRIKMLESEKLYQLGLRIGEKGDAYGGFKCGDKQYILNLSRLFNESSTIGQEATGIWDDLLTRYPKTRPFLTKDERPKFYDSPFWPIRRYSIRNMNISNQLCP